MQMRERNAIYDFCAVCAWMWLCVVAFGDSDPVFKMASGWFPPDLFHPLFGTTVALENGFRLDGSASTTQGTVIAHRPSFYVTYRFNAGENSYIHEQQVDQATFDRLEDNSQVQVEYLVAEPGAARLAGIPNYVQRGSSVFDSVVTSGALFGLLVISLNTADRLLNNYQWQRFDINTQGVIVKRREDKDENNSVTYHVTYRFHGKGEAHDREVRVFEVRFRPTGAAQDGAQAYQREVRIFKGTYDQLLEGTAVLVKYRADKPTFFRMVEPSGIEAANYGCLTGLIVVLLWPLLMVLTGFLVMGRWGVVLLLLVVASLISWRVLHKQIKRLRLHAFRV